MFGSNIEMIKLKANMSEYILFYFRFRFIFNHKFEIEILIHINDPWWLIGKHSFIWFNYLDWDVVSKRFSYSEVRDYIKNSICSHSEMLDSDIFAPSMCIDYMLRRLFGLKYKFLAVAIWVFLQSYRKAIWVDTKESLTGFPWRISTLFNRSDFNRLSQECHDSSSGIPEAEFHCDFT